MNVVFEPACEAHVHALLENLREHDKPTIAAADDPAGRLIDAIRTGTEAYAVVFDGEIGCLWGANERSLLSPPFLWMVTTPFVERHPTAFARHAIKRIRRILAEYGEIGGTVVTWNSVAIKWVTWLGATLRETPAEGVLEFRLRADSHPRWRA